METSVSAHNFQRVINRLDVVFDREWQLLELGLHSAWPLAVTSRADSDGENQETRLRQSVAKVMAWENNPGEDPLLEEHAGLAYTDVMQDYVVGGHVQHHLPDVVQQVLSKASYSQSPELVQSEGPAASQRETLIQEPKDTTTADNYTQTLASASVDEEVMIVGDKKLFTPKTFMNQLSSRRKRGLDVYGTTFTIITGSTASEDNFADWEHVAHVKEEDIEIVRPRSFPMCYIFWHLVILPGWGGAFPSSESVDLEILENFPRLTYLRERTLNGLGEIVTAV